MYYQRNTNSYSWTNIYKGWKDSNTYMVKKPHKTKLPFSNKIKDKNPLKIRFLKKTHHALIPTFLKFKTKYAQKLLNLSGKELTTGFGITELCGLHSISNNANLAKINL